MKKRLLIILVALIPVVGFTTHYVYELETAKAEVEEVVLKSYINGAFNELNYEDMAAGFHPDFAIFSIDGEKLKRYEIADWVAGVKKRKMNPEFDAAKNKWEHKFPNIDITGTSAVVKVELFRKGDHVYTDYLSLLKFDSGWKIVGKVYTKHE